MKIRELYECLDARIPTSLSCEWDNDGLMVCANPEREVRRVLIALDITAEVVERAVEGGFDAVISHHPLVFRPLRAVEPSNPVAKKVIRLLAAGVTAMSFHTRLDAVTGGVNDTLAAALGLSDVIPFGNGEETIGRIGTLSRELTLGQFVEEVKRATGVPFVLASDAGVRVRRVAILGGSGSDDVLAASRAGADTYLSGELAHHHLTDAPERGMNLIAAGHFHTENPVCESLARMIGEIDRKIEVELMNSNPIRLL